MSCFSVGWIARGLVGLICLAVAAATDAQAALRIEGLRLEVQRTHEGLRNLDLRVSRIASREPGANEATLAVRDAGVHLEEFLEDGSRRDLKLENFNLIQLPPGDDGRSDFEASAILITDAGRGTVAIDGHTLSIPGDPTQIEANLNGRNLDLGPVLLPLNWIHELEGIASVNLTIRGSLSDGFRGDAVLDFPETRLNLAGIVIEGHGDLDTNFTWRDRKLVLHEALVNAERVRFAGHQTRTVRCEFDFIDKEFIARDLRFNAHDGRWVQSGRIGVSPPARFEVDTEVSGASLAKIASVVAPDAHVSEELGSLNGAARLSGEWDREPGWSKTVKGGGVVEIVGGTLRSFHLFRSALGSLSGLFPRIVPRSVDFSGTRPTQIHRVFQPFRIQDSAAWTDSLVVVTDDYAVSGSGQIGLDGALGLEVRVTFTEQGFGKMFGVAKVPLPSRVIDILPPLPAKIEGTLTQPDFSMDLSQVRPGAFDALFANVRGATGIITRPARKLGEAAGRGLERLGSGVGEILGGGDDDEN